MFQAVYYLSRTQSEFFSNFFNVGYSARLTVSQP